MSMRQLHESDSLKITVTDVNGQRQASLQIDVPVCESKPFIAPNRLTIVNRSLIMHFIGLAVVTACLVFVQPFPKQQTAIDAELVGTWGISYHPNAATRIYTIDKSGKATFSENGEEWAGSLIAVKPNANSSFMLRFDRDPEDRKERITLCKDGRIMVEHFNPSHQERPDQIGIGQKKQ